MRSSELSTENHWFGRHRTGVRFTLAPGYCLSLAILLAGCRSHHQDTVTLTFLDPEWSHDVRTRSILSDAALREFTSQTGIQVKHIPAPETDSAQRALVQELLQKGDSGPDVYSIDVIWPGMLNDHLVDLSPYFGSQLSADDPEVAANYRLNGKLVAVPYHANVGVLYYRTDLLHKYGYKHPPRTWDELEEMAWHIQQGERARGERDFWGFVWPGAASQQLTCVALEWQAAEGGGRIIEADKNISVNNPAAIRSWERAKNWVGRISPPGVLSYQEWDAINAFSNSGRAAFLRGWASDYFLLHPRDEAIGSSEGITSVPGSKAMRVATLGGSGLAISESSRHRAEAIQLVRFLLQKDQQSAAASLSSGPSAGSRELFELPLLLKAYPNARKMGSAQGAKVVIRPSTITGNDYGAVSRAYVRAVHSVLTGETKAPEAAAGLEKELTKITGFRSEPIGQKF